MKSCDFVLLVVLSVILVPGALGAKILAVFQVPTRSHHIIGSSLLMGLAAKGHEVTMISPFPLKERVANYRDIPLEGMQEITDEGRKLITGAPKLSSWQKMTIFFNYTNIIAEKTLRSTEVQNLLKSDETFDLIIIKTFGNEAFFGLGHRFKAPIIVVSTAISQFVNHLSGNLSPASYVPHGLTTYSDQMTFIERYINTCVGILFDICQRIMITPLQQQLYYEYFRDGPSFEQITKSVSMILINSNFVFETPRPYMPNMISIGGIHIKEPKPLSQELITFMDGATEGVVLFSLGSNLRSSDLPMEKRTMVLNALGKLPQRILLKFEDEDLPGKPDNVKIGKWFPQSDILAHPKVKLFITHGGLLSSTEAVYWGVPVLGIPFFGDQHSNTEKIQNSGYGLKLQYDDLTEELFLKQIQEILKNSKYRNAIKRGSDIIKDQPMQPLEKAIYWTEYVIKHKGAPHLRAASVDLSFIKYFLIDVIVFTVVVLFTIIMGIILVFKRFLGSPNSQSNVIPKICKLK